MSQAKLIAGCAAVALAALALASCGGSAESAETTTAATTTAAATAAPATTAAPVDTGSSGIEAATEEATKGPWTFTDDRGVTVSLPKRPTRIVAYIGTAAVLWDFGVRPIGVFGPQRQADGTPEPAAGRVDLDAVESAGETWDGVNLEALAALQPDLVVTGMATGSLWAIPVEQVDKVTKIAPLIAIDVYDRPATEILASYEELAAALGADLETPELQQARQEFTAASDELEAASAAKPGLLALVTYADKEGLYIAKVKDFPDLLDFQRLGLEIVEPGGSEDYWEMLSWELAGKYPADLILHDERSFSLQPEALAEFPTWAALPAVQAGQVAPWNAETILSYQGFGAALSRLAAAVRNARADVVPP